MLGEFVAVNQYYLLLYSFHVVSCVLGKLGSRDEHTLSGPFEIEASGEGLDFLSSNRARVPPLRLDSYNIKSQLFFVDYSIYPTVTTSPYSLSISPGTTVT